MRIFAVSRHVYCYSTLGTFVMVIHNESFKFQSTDFPLAVSRLLASGQVHQIDARGHNVRREVAQYFDSVEKTHTKTNPVTVTKNVSRL